MPKVLLLVEGIDDAKAFEHVTDVYKTAGKIDNTFADIDVAVVPAGGKNSIQHWVALDLLTQLSKPYVVWLDSDRDCEDGKSSLDNLHNAGFTEGVDLFVSYKRSLENYIPSRCLQEFVPTSTPLSYGHWDDVKTLCRKWPDEVERAKLGGASVARKYFHKLTIEDLEEAYSLPNGQDEFLVLYKAVTAKLNSIL